MGTGTLTSIGTGSPVNATGDQLDQYKAALGGNLVPRNTSGVPTDLGGDLGTASYRFNQLNVSTAVIGGTAIDPTVLTSKNNRLTAYRVDANDFPNHLVAMGANSLTVQLHCTSTACTGVINGTSFSLTSNVNFTIAAGYTNNNTLAINESSWTAASSQEQQSLVFGEKSHESVIMNYDGAGTNISGLSTGDKVFFYGTNSSAEIEIVYAEMITVGATGTLRPLWRGVDSSGTRRKFRDNDVWRLCKATWLFIDTAGTAYTTTVHPIEAEVLPSAGTAGRYIYLTGSQAWYYDDGASITQVSRIPIGVGISHNTTDCSYWAVLPEWDMFKDTYFNHKKSDVQIQFAIDPLSTSKGLIINGSVKVGNKTFTYNNRRINTATSADRIDSTADISAVGIKYVYASYSTGQLVFSDVMPRKWFDGVFFHPNKMNRCVGFFFHTSSAFYPFTMSENKEIIFNNDVSVSTAFTTSFSNYPIQAGHVPSFLKQIYCNYKGYSNVGVMDVFTANSFSDTTGIRLATSENAITAGSSFKYAAFSGYARGKVNNTIAWFAFVFIGYEL